jgi:hypothetical protein
VHPLHPGKDLAPDFWDVHRAALDALVAELVPALAAAGATPLLIKGPAFAQWLYDDPVERHYADVDLLVAGEAVPDARQVFRAHGLRPVVTGLHDHEHSRHHEVWSRGRSLRTPVELHRTLALVEADDATVWRRLSEGRRRIEVAGVPVEVPGFAACALIVALHAAQHGIGAGRPMADLARAVARVELETWREAAALAEVLGAAAAFALGLRLHPAGRALAGELGLPEAASRALRLHAATPPRTALGIEQVVSARGARARLALLGRKVAPSREFMRHNYPPARRGRAQLAGAYAVRLGELAARLPRGMQAWLAASRKS